MIAITLRILAGSAIFALSFAGLATVTSAQSSVPVFKPGPPLSISSGPSAESHSDNIKAFGAIVSAESCSYDVTRKLIVVPSRGAEQHAKPNDAFISLINHDGSVHTPFWIGATRDGLILNQPYGSDIQLGKLYLADSDGGTEEGMPITAVIRMFDMQNGAPTGEIPVPKVEWFNDIAVAPDGTIYATQTRSNEDDQRLFRISPKGETTLLVDGAPLGHPNGVALDNDGNVVVVNIDDTAVLTFSPEGRLLKTEHAAQPGNDGLVILSDGTKYVSSVRHGGVSRIAPGQGAELIAEGIPNAASMCYDPDAHQLVIPMNANNGLAFVKLR